MVAMRSAQPGNAGLHRVQESASHGDGIPDHREVTVMLVRIGSSEEVGPGQMRVFDVRPPGAGSAAGAFPVGSGQGG